MTYAFDPAMAPDADFVPGTLAHLVAGNTGRMLDPRRTPVRIESLREEAGFFVLRILAFEDAGAEWEIPFESVIRFQFARESATAPDETTQALAAVVARFDRPHEIACDPERARATVHSIAEQRRAAARWLATSSRFFAARSRLDAAARTGDPLLFEDLHAWMAERDLADVESGFARRFVSNPASGDLVKGHRVVLAELGLVPYAGTVLRDPEVFAGRMSRERRAAHVVARFAFVQAALERGGLARPVLYRGLAFDGTLEPSRNHGFVSATFNREVALELFEPPRNTGDGALYRQAVSLERVFMTYFETPQMNDRFHEAEAVLLFDPANALF